MVITFADISEMKAAEREIEAARAYSDSIIDTIRQPLVVLDDELRVVSANRSFYGMFALEAAEDRRKAARRPSPVIIPAAPGLRAFLDRVRAELSVEDHEIEIELPTLGRRMLLLNARKDPRGASGQAQDPAGDRRHHRAQARRGGAGRRQAQAEQANLGKSRFLAAASHDLRQPLQTMSLLQGILAKKVTDEDRPRAGRRLDETLGAMSGHAEHAARHQPARGRDRPPRDR